MTRPEFNPDCWVCVNIEEVKWNGDSNVSHCKRCHSLWRRVSKTAHCTSCCRTFATDRVAEAHRKYHRNDANDYTFECMDPATVTTKKGPAYGAPVPNSYGTPTWHGYNANFKHGASASEASTPAEATVDPQNEISTL